MIKFSLGKPFLTLKNILTGDDTPTAWGKNNQKVAGKGAQKTGAQTAKTNQKSVTFNKKVADKAPEKVPDKKTAKNVSQSKSSW